MKLVRMSVALLVVAGVAGVACLAQRDVPAGAKMTEAAVKFVSSLEGAQKTKATFAFDDKERTNWHFVPLQDDATKKSTRRGLPLEEMSAEQKQAALALVAAGTSPTGNTKATTIMSLEAILHDLEKDGRMVRNPEWYFFSVFGQPDKSGKWGWRVEGHHLSLNFVVDKGKIVASTPAFFGANPATVKAGPRKGLRTLPEVEELAQKLFKTFDAEQKKTAYFETPFSEIEQAKAAPTVGPAKGLPASKMNETQREMLMSLLQSYANRMPAEIAREEMAQVKEAGLDKVHFAHAGGTEPGKPYTYQVQGPTFLIEFLNVQPDSANNPANHIHSVWRNIKGDFGLAVR